MRLVDPLARFVDTWRRTRHGIEIRAWDGGLLGETVPAGLKYRIVRELAVRYQLEAMVETGTRFGDMIAATCDLFTTVYSIELDRALYRRASRRFRRMPRVRIVPGDSAEMLGFVLPKIDRPCLFWLDAHQMAGGVRGHQVTPIREELAQIVESRKEGLILIDDARLYSGRGAYPSLAELCAIANRSTADLEVSCDILRLRLPKPGTLLPT